MRLPPPSPPCPAPRRSGSAITLAARHRVDGEWRELTYAEVVRGHRRGRAGARRAGHRARRPGRHPRRHAAGVDAGQLRDLGGGRRRGARLPHQLAPASARGCWATPAPGRWSARTTASVAKVEQVRGELPDLEHVIGIERRRRRHVAGRAARARPRRATGPSWTSASHAVDARGRLHDHLHLGDHRPAQGRRAHPRATRWRCARWSRSSSSSSPARRTYLFLPLAHAFALTAQLASYDQGTAIVYFGGDTKQILPEVIETKPTYLPSVPRIFEKLYTAAHEDGRGQAREEDRERFAPGGQARRRGAPAPRARRGGPRRRWSRPSSRPRSGSTPACAACSAATSTRPSPAPRRSRPRSSSSSTPAGVPVLEGWGMTETTGVGTVVHARPLQVRHRRAAAAGRRDPDRRGGRRDPRPRAPRLPRVLAQPRGDRRDAGRRLAAHRRRRRARRRGLPVDHRPQEGHHHHRRRQEPHAVQHRERPQAEPLHLPGGHARRPPAVSRWR